MSIQDFRRVNEEDSWQKEVRGISFEWWSEFSNLFFLLNITLALTVVFFERKRPAATWAWLMVLFFLPVVGFFLYLFFGRSFDKSNLKHQSAYYHPELEELNEKQLCKLKAGSFSFAARETEEAAALIRMNLKSETAPLFQDNRLKLYTDGRLKFEDLFRDIEQAEHHIHLEYYILKEDEIGTRLIRALTEKAKEGVRVLLLYDAVGSNKLSAGFLRDFYAAGGKAEAFMPSKIPFINTRMNYRNHRKIGIIDGKWGYIGGFNVGDEYLGKKGEYGYWRDTHIRIDGSAVHSLQHRFLLDWNQTSRTHPVKHASAYFPAFPDRTGAAMQVISSGPDETMDQVKNGFLKLISQAEKTLFLQTPYFIPDTAVLDALRVAALGGTDVRIMIPDQSDHAFVHAATLAFVDELLDAGVRVYQYQNGFLHAKTIVADSKIFTVGSANMDVRSFSLNFEGNAFVYDRAAADDMDRIFRRDMELSKELTKEDLEGHSLYERGKRRVARLLAPLL